MPAPRRTDPAEGRAALDRALGALDAGQEPVAGDVRTAVRFLLESLAARVPGRAVEVRVPPYAAVQVVAGPRHIRGTPPSVVETDPATWLRLATGRLAWAEAVRGGTVSAGGERSDLSAYLPLARGIDRDVRR